MFGVLAPLASLKVVGVLVLLLALSAAGNVWQLRADAREDGAREAQQTAADQLGAAIQKVEAQGETLRRTFEIADAARADRDALVLELQSIADRAQHRQVVYRDRIRQAPPLSCAPGEYRMDAVNELLAIEARQAAEAQSR